MSKTFSDSYVMFKRCMKKTLRSPEAMTMAIVVPFVMMVLFGMVIGGVVEMEGMSYISFVVPGIILQCVCNSAIATSLNVQNDMTKGIIDRFRSMRVAKSAFIQGHVWVSVIRSVAITAATIGAAFAIGFRPTAGLLEWLAAIGILLLVIIAVTWLVMIIGLTAKNAESISGANALVMLFVFMSSAFAPPEGLPLVLRVFAQHQPMTPIIDALRGLLLGVPMTNEIWIALAWCIGIIIVAYIVAVGVYKSKLTK